MFRPANDGLSSPQFTGKDGATGRVDAAIVGATVDRLWHHRQAVKQHAHCQYFRNRTSRISAQGQSVTASSKLAKASSEVRMENDTRFGIPLNIADIKAAQSVSVVTRIALPARCNAHLSCPSSDEAAGGGASHAACVKAS